MKYLLIALLLVGCANFDKADTLIKSGEVEEDILQVKYSIEDKQAIKNAIDQYLAFRERWEDLIGLDLVLPKTNRDLLFSDYEKLKTTYLAIYEIVEKKFNQYSAETQAELLNDHEEAKRIDASMQRMQTVDEVARYANVILKTAIKLL